MTTASNLYDEATTPETVALVRPHRVLTIGAHPDDAEFGAGGTVAKWAAEGSHITILVVSDGSKGSWDGEVDPEALIAQRRREQRAAADALGVTEVVMLDHVDGEVENTPRLRRELCWWIRTIRPDVVFTHDPWKRYMLHPDHRATGMAAIDAVVAARDHLFFPDQGLDKHRPDHILLWSADEVDHIEDIKGTFDAKIAALLQHSSQATTTMGGAASGDLERQRFVDRIRAWTSEMGEAAGLECAEAFKRLSP